MCSDLLLFHLGSISGGLFFRFALLSPVFDSSTLILAHPPNQKNISLREHEVPPVTTLGLECLVGAPFILRSIYISLLASVSSGCLRPYLLHPSLLAPALCFRIVHIFSWRCCATSYTWLDLFSVSLALLGYRLTLEALGTTLGGRHIV